MVSAFSPLLQHRPFSSLSITNNGNSKNMNIAKMWKTKTLGMISDNQAENPQDNNKNNQTSSSIGTVSDNEKEIIKTRKRNNKDRRRRQILVGSVGWVLSVPLVYTIYQDLSVMAKTMPSGFQRLPQTQFIAALGNPQANQGTNAHEWGLWPVDPGPRGTFLSQFDSNNKNNNDVFWIEEHGIVMPPPTFPLSPGTYLVTGGRQVTTTLEIASNGEWKLGANQDGTMPATLGDVTHLPCRAAKYKPTTTASNSDATKMLTSNVNLRDFPVKPGAAMPPITEFDKQDYAVLFVLGIKR